LDTEKTALCEEKLFASYGYLHPTVPSRCTEFADGPGKWAYLALGLLTLAAPWILGFGATATAVWTHVILGAAVAAAGIRRLFVPSHPAGPDPHAT
jgi:hypothetical protein